MDEADRLLDTYRENLQDDPRMTNAQRNYLIGRANNVQQQRRRHFTEVATVMHSAVAENADAQQIAVIFGHSIYVNDLVREQLDSMMTAAHTTALTTQETMVREQRNARILLWVMCAVATVLFVVVTAVISKSISKPIGKIVTALDEVASGNFNINTDRRDVSASEIGMLTQGIANVAGTLKGITDDLAGIHYEYNELGKSNYRIDTSKYQNAFKEVAESINQLVEAEVSNVHGVVGILNQIGDGDFDIEVEELPGDFNIQSQAIRNVTSNLKNVSTEVNTMIKTIAVKGDLNFRIDTSKYAGDWQGIMNGLNEISKAVAEPIAIADICLTEMQKG
ncbi:MAG: HAMP domain-containing protein, partial [Defluviitaleaceae bacterium]|nr:HAMP domain-containing protein [Defluviitaleaceae bacterium]